MAVGDAKLDGGRSILEKVKDIAQGKDLSLLSDAEQAHLASALVEVAVRDDYTIDAAERKALQSVGVRLSGPARSIIDGACERAAKGPTYADVHRAFDDVAARRREILAKAVDKDNPSRGGRMGLAPNDIDEQHIFNKYWGWNGHEDFARANEQVPEYVRRVNAALALTERWLDNQLKSGRVVPRELTELLGRAAVEAGTKIQIQWDPIGPQEEHANLFDRTTEERLSRLRRLFVQTKDAIGNAPLTNEAVPIGLESRK